MAKQSKRRRAPLSRERVLRAALKIADKGGLEALSMRKLAQQLGVEAMSLYNHVASKDDIVGGMLDLVAEEMELPPEGADWKAALRQSAISSHEVLMRHRWTAGLWMSPRDPSPIRLRGGDAVLRTFREAGFSEDLTYHAFHVLQAHVLGFTLYLQSLQFDAAQLEELAADFMRDFPVGEYPYLAEHIRQHAEPSDERHRTFEFGLDLVLDGLQKLRDAGATRPAR
jgi:AcrR family transcriptional regulator